MIKKITRKLVEKQSKRDEEKFSTGLSLSLCVFKDDRITKLKSRAREERERD